jgi:hypothetical protein
MALPVDPYVFTIEILSKLDITDILRLRQVNNFYRQFITANKIPQVIADRMRQRLTVIFGENLPKFYQVLEENCGVISGSFTIQCVLDENWTGSDIDIFVPVGSDDDHIVGGDGLTSIESFLMLVMGFTLHPLSGRRRYIDMNDSDIITVNNFQAPQTTIQVVQIGVDNSISSIKEHIYRSFDYLIILYNIKYYHSNVRGSFLFVKEAER